MKTVYADVPHNPNLRMKLRILDDSQDDIFDHHFGGESDEKEEPFIGLRSEKLQPLPYKDVDKNKPSMKILINGLYDALVTQENMDQIEFRSKTNFLIYSMIAYAEQQPLNAYSRDQLAKILSGVFENRTNNFAQFIVAWFEDLTKKGVFIQRMNQDVGIPVIDFNAFLVQNGVDSNDAIGLIADVEQAYEEWSKDEFEDDEKMMKLIEAWATDTLSGNKYSAENYNVYLRGIREWFKKRLPRGVVPPVYLPDEPVLKDEPILKDDPVVIKDPEAVAVAKIERELDQIMRRALQPLYLFIGQLATALLESDIRKFYRYANKKYVTEYELQGIVKMGNRTFADFYENNRHLGDLIIHKTLESLRGPKEPMLKRPKVAIKKEPKPVGNPFGIAFPAPAQMQQDVWERFMQYAADASNEPLLGGIDAADWYWCALPYASFQVILATTSVAAFDWAASAIWRYTNRRDFTIPLLIKSPDTRDVFATMVRNKYMLTMGSAYSESLTVNSGGGSSKRFMTGPGYKAQNMRAMNNLTAKIWFQSVVLVNNQNEQTRARIREMDRKTAVARVLSRQGVRFLWSDTPDLKARLENGLREAGLQEEDIQQYVGQIEAIHADIDDLAEDADADEQRLAALPKSALINKWQNDYKYLTLDRRCFEEMTKELKHYEF